MTNPQDVRSRSLTYTILLEPDEDGGFVVTCPALPGLVTHGDTVEEGRAHAAEAMVLYLECLEAEGSPFPAGQEPPDGARQEPITVELPGYL